MSGIKNNRRTQYTRHAIEGALVSLLQQEPLEKITVTAICQAADVNRGTFYRYYLDPMDCFDTIQNTFYQEMGANTPLFDQQHPEVFLTAILTTFQQNAPLMKAFLLNQHTTMLAEFMEHQQQLTQNPVPADNPISRYEQGFYTSGIISICRQWLAADMPETPTELAQVILNIIFKIPKNIPEPVQIDHQRPTS